MEILLSSGEVENGIAHELAGAMEGSLSTAVDFDDGMGEVLMSFEAGFIAGPSDRVNRGMLEEENGVLDRLGTPTLHEVLLKVPDLLEIKIRSKVFKLQ